MRRAGAGLFVLISLVGFGLVSTAAHPGSVDAQDRARVSALESLRRESTRIAAANDYWLSQLRDYSGVQDQRLVSLSRPIRVFDLLQATSKGKEGSFHLLAVNTWMLAPGSLHPKVGSWPGEMLSNFSAADAVREMTRSSLEYLRMRKGAIRDLADAGAISRPAARAQIRDVSDTIAAVKELGLQSYGFACLCSPRMIAMLSLPLRAVEPLDEFGKLPVFPQQPLRDAVLSGEQI